MLSGLRDEQARAETLEALRGRFPDELGDPYLRALTIAPGASGNGAREGHGKDPIDGAMARIEAGRDAIAEWRLEGKDWELIEDGLRRAYRRGRKRLADVVAEPTDENVH